MKFWLGTHLPGWLGRTDVPLFLSARRLRGRKTFPKPLGTWALDSGGFSELTLFGEWVTPATQYASEVRKWRDEVGGLDWAAIQDWMCEPHMLARTRFTVGEHQRRTVGSYHLLRRLAPDLPWVPVLQGWRLDDYRRHVEMYAASGVYLEALPIVGLGSVCRRQGTAEVLDIVRELANLGIRLHGFGMKTAGLEACGPLLASADSLAWSFTARRRPPLPDCPHRSCANCLRFALRWRGKVLARVGRRFRPTLF